MSDKPAVPQARCEFCNYTEEDAKIQMDHSLCKNAGNAPWEKSKPSSSPERCPTCHSSDKAVRFCIRCWKSEDKHFKKIWCSESESSIAQWVRCESTWHTAQSVPQPTFTNFLTVPQIAEKLRKLAKETDDERLMFDLPGLADILDDLAVPAPVEASPYPFDEVVDSGAMVRFNMDGDKWCANRLPFTNMMEMPVGFGETPMQALVELIKAETSAIQDIREAQESEPSVELEKANDALVDELTKVYEEATEHVRTIQLAKAILAADRTEIAKLLSSVESLKRERDEQKEQFICAIGRLLAGATRKQTEECVEGYIREWNEGKKWPK